jgi:hypothetical protein
MHEVIRLRSAMVKLASCKPYERAAIEKEILIRGSRVSTWIRETYGLLDKQLSWLDLNETAPSYEQRFREWETLLRDYGQACDVLTEAKALNVGVAA